jgi:hypothetical protein
MNSATGNPPHFPRCPCWSLREVGKYVERYGGSGTNEEQTLLASNPVLPTKPMGVLRVHVTTDRTTSMTTTPPNFGDVPSPERD